MTAVRITFDANTAFISGPKSEIRRRLAACGDPSPFWVPRRQAWATSIATANAVLGQLEARRIAVLIEHADQAEIGWTETVPANVAPERQGALW